MNPSNASPRFLLIPELEPAVGSNQPVLRRYSLARLPQLRAEPAPRGGGSERE